MQFTKNAFIFLSVSGGLLLWLTMLFNGMLKAMLLAMNQGVLPNKRPLETSYTGIPGLDHWFTILVIFFDSVTDGHDLGVRLLILELAVTLHIALIWWMIDSLRDGQKSTILR